MTILGAEEEDDDGDEEEEEAMMAKIEKKKKNYTSNKIPKTVKIRGSINVTLRDNIKEKKHRSMEDI